MSVLYVTPGYDGMDYEFTWDDIAWEAFERIWKQERDAKRFFRTIIFLILTCRMKRGSYARPKTPTR